MSIGNQVKITAITAFVQLLGHGDLFPRVVAEMKRVNETMPNATGADKRKKLLADAEIIFTDLVEPVAEAVLNLLIELGVQYLQAEVLAKGK